MKASLFTRKTSLTCRTKFRMCNRARGFFYPLDFPDSAAAGHTCEVAQ